MTLLLGASILLCLYMAWTIGANDVANSMGDAVGSRAISVRGAIVLAAVFELAGALLFGAHVTDTIRKGIIPPDSMVGRPEVLVLGMGCAVASAAAWLHIATRMGMPVSTTHSIVGGVAGFGIVAAGWGALRWGNIAQIAASWVISPVAGGVFAYLLFRVITRLILAKEKPAKAAMSVCPLFVFFTVFAVLIAAAFGAMERFLAENFGAWAPAVGASSALCLGLLAALTARVALRRFLADKLDRPTAEQLGLTERVFAPLVVFTSCSVAFAHGANDVANAVGPLAAIVDVARSGTIEMSVHVPVWLLALGGVGIVLGLSTYGYRVMRTIGDSITQLTPSRGVAADIATTTTVLVCTRLKLPISTTHTIVGAIIGIGLARGLGAIDSKVIGRIFGAWLLTVPAAAGLAVVLFLLGRITVLDWLGAVMLEQSGGLPL